MLCLKHDEMNIIIDCTTEHQVKVNHFIRKSWRALEKGNVISVLFGDGDEIRAEKTPKYAYSERLCIQSNQTPKQCQYKGNPQGAIELCSRYPLLSRYVGRMAGQMST
jgi:hypothetical protein